VVQFNLFAQAHDKAVLVAMDLTLVREQFQRVAQALAVQTQMVQVVVAVELLATVQMLLVQLVA
jgi:hypothetical protein